MCNFEGRAGNAEVGKQRKDKGAFEYSAALTKELSSTDKMFTALLSVTKDSHD